MKKLLVLISCLPFVVLADAFEANHSDIKWHHSVKLHGMGGKEGLKLSFKPLVTDIGYSMKGFGEGLECTEKSENCASSGWDAAEDNGPIIEVIEGEGPVENDVRMNINAFADAADTKGSTELLISAADDYFTSDYYSDWTLDCLSNISIWVKGILTIENLKNGRISSCPIILSLIYEGFWNISIPKSNTEEPQCNDLELRIHSNGQDTIKIYRGTNIVS